MLSSVVRTSFLYYYLSGLEYLSWVFSWSHNRKANRFSLWGGRERLRNAGKWKTLEQSVQTLFFVLIVKCAYLRRFFFLFFCVAVVIMVTLGFLNFGAFSTCHYWDQFWLVPIVCILQLTGSVRRDGRINARGEKKKDITPAAVSSLRSNQVHCVGLNFHKTYDIKTIYLHSSSFNNRIAFMRVHLMLT